MLAKYGTLINKDRQKFIQEIDDKLTTTYRSIANNKDIVNLEYKTEITNHSESSYLNLLEQNFHKDVCIGHTSFGVHRDDYIFKFNHKIADGSASRGETRSIILALKFIEANIIADTLHKKPIILPLILYSDK